MKINWKLRLQSKTTLLSLIGLLAMLINQIANAFGFDCSPQVATIVAIATTLVSIGVAVGVVNDPTVKGMDDSDMSMQKESPTDPQMDLTIKGEDVVTDESEVVVDNTEAQTDSTTNTDYTAGPPLFYGGNRHEQKR